MLAGYSDIAQVKWAAWRRKQNLTDRTPVEFTELIDEFITFADPAIAGATAGLQWNPTAKAWT